MQQQQGGEATRIENLLETKPPAQLVQGSPQFFSMAANDHEITVDTASPPYSQGRQQQQRGQHGHGLMPAALASPVTPLDDATVMMSNSMSLSHNPQNPIYQLGGDQLHGGGLLTPTDSGVISISRG